ncbi:hypothetical protein IVB28_14585 [Bradyrhizobium sp. 199]|nr:hypothetical protein [Bradyrhizobium sp. 199]
MVIDRNGAAAQKRVAGEEMLVAIGRQRTLLDEACADAAGIEMMHLDERGHEATSAARAARPDATVASTGAA